MRATAQIIKNEDARSTAVNFAQMLARRENEARTVSTIGNLRVGRTRRPLLDVGRGNKICLSEGSARAVDLFDVLERNTSRVTLGTGRGDDTLKPLVVLGRDRHSGSLQG